MRRIKARNSAEIGGRPPWFPDQFEQCSDDHVYLDQRMQ
jgi:hypothetical protein